MNIEDQLWQHYACTGRGHRLYLVVSRYEDWWYYAPFLDKWAVFSMCFLVVGIVGLVLARLIGG